MLHRSASAARRRVLAAIAAGPAVGVAPGSRAAAPVRRPPVEVWKDPNCGCCRDWVAYLEREGF
jgi:hypothetical protein